MKPIPDDILHRSHIDRDIVGRAIEGGIVGSLAFLFGQHLAHTMEGPGAIVGAIWSAIAGLVVLQTGRGEIVKFSALQAVGTFIGALVSALYLIGLPPSIWGLALCTCVTTLACYALRISDQARLASATSVVIMGVSILSKVRSPFINAELRFLESLIGLALAVGVSLSLSWIRRVVVSLGRKLPKG